MVKLDIYLTKKEYKYFKKIEKITGKSINEILKEILNTKLS